MTSYSSLIEHVILSLYAERYIYFIVTVNNLQMLRFCNDLWNCTVKWEKKRLQRQMVCLRNGVFRIYHRTTTTTAQQHCWSIVAFLKKYTWFWLSFLILYTSINKSYYVQSCFKTVKMVVANLIIKNSLKIEFYITLESKTDV